MEGSLRKKGNVRRKFYLKIVDTITGNRREEFVYASSFSDAEGMCRILCNLTQDEILESITDEG